MTFRLSQLYKFHLLIQVRSFTTEAEVDAWFLNQPMYSPGALHFIERNGTTISYGVQTNSTAVQQRGKYEDPAFKFQIPLQIAAEREMARFLIGGIFHFLLLFMILSFSTICLL